MKKIFKGIAVLAAAATIGTGLAFATGCGGSDGVYKGEYHYTNAYGATYGMVVEVTVKNNIITEVKDITNTDGAKKDYQNGVEWTTVSPGWVDKYVAEYDENNPYSYPVKPDIGNWGLNNADEIAALMPDYYQWTNANAAVWTTYENWLLQQYVGWSVADVLDVSVFYSTYGEPYSTNYNAELASSGLLLTGSTQGSGRLLLAVQNALSK